VGSNPDITFKNDEIKNSLFNIQKPIYTSKLKNELIKKIWVQDDEGRKCNSWIVASDDEMK